MKKKCKRKGHKYMSHYQLIWLTKAGVELTLYRCVRCGKTRVDS